MNKQFNKLLYSSLSLDYLNFFLKILTKNINNDIIRVQRKRDYKNENCCNTK